MRKSIVFSLAALLFAASCSNDTEFVQTGTSKRDVKCEFSATLPEFKSGGELETKASLESVVRIKWSAGDRLTVINLTRGTQMGGYLLADREGYNTTFTPTNLNGTVNAGDKLVFWYNTTQDISVAEEKAFSPISVDLTEQNGGQNNVPIVGYAEYTATEDGVIEAENLQFVFLVSYVQLALSALPASTSITAFEVNNVNSTGEFRIEDGRFVFAKSKGKVKLVDPFTANTKGANVRYFSLFASEAEASARMATITANGQDHETAWIKAGLSAGSYYQSVATGFANENIQFVDETFKAYCVSHYDGNNDGEVSFAEAAAITGYAPFTAAEKEAIRSVYELAYFPANIGIPSFEGCTGLKYILLPGTVAEIPANNFKGCTSLEEINIPDNVTSVGVSAFENCTSLRYFSGNLATDDHQFLVDGEDLLAYAPSEHGYVVIPDYIRNINPAVFKNCSNIKTVVLSSTATIGEQAFFGCTQLESVNIVATVERIDKEGFRGCEKLYKVYAQSETPATLGSDVFTDCNENFFVMVSEKNVDAYRSAGWTLYEIEPCVWHQIFYTTTDNQPIEFFFDGKFAHGYGQNGKPLQLLSNEYVDGRGVITFSGDLYELDQPWYGWEYDYVEDAEITTPGVDWYWWGFNTMFTNQTRLTSLVLPESLERMPSVRGCTNLESINIPKSVTHIVNWETEDCRKLAQFTGPATTEDGLFIVFGDCLAKVAPAGCPAEITIPGYVTSIGDFAFCYCWSLKKVTIPETTTYIGVQPFRSLTIDEYIFRSVVPPLLPFNFGGSGTAPLWITEHTKIYVPSVALDTYRTAGGEWTDEYASVMIGY